MTPQALIDISSSVLCGLISVGAFTIHIVTSPRRPHWIVLPGYIRGGVFASGVMFLIRSASLGPGDTAISGQHMPPLGFLTTLVVGWTVCALAVWAIRSYVPQHHADGKRTHPASQ